MSQVRSSSNPRITVFPATRNRYTAAPLASEQKRKVAAYARVSTDSEEQKNSYNAQISYYTNQIKSRPSWEFVGVYTDEGITGTNTMHRDGFNRMIGDALNGKIDLIVTKSVSRFARNTVDTLSTVRKLKDCGVEVYFEKENIYTLDSKGELMITIMSSLAQEESRSISENVTWGQRKRFADGKVAMPYSRFLGYRKGENGEPEIVPEEAEIVLRIYRLFLSGKTTHGITKVLEAEHIPTPAGKTKWRTSTVLNILTNEKYKGDALLQKSFCIDFLTKKMKVNEGEIPQYYVENSHPAIVSKEMFEQVQREIARRKDVGRYHRGTSPFAGKLVCECCGGFYGSKTWHSTDKYRKTIWRCNLKYKGAEKCATPYLTEDEIGMLFVRAFNQLITDHEFIIEEGEALIALLTDTSALERELASLVAELQITQSLQEQAIHQNATQALDQQEYQLRFEALSERYEKARIRKDQIDRQIQQRSAKRNMLAEFIDLLRTGEVLVKFDPDLWTATVDTVVVCRDQSCRFRFKNGSEITV